MIDRILDFVVSFILAVSLTRRTFQNKSEDLRHGSLRRYSLGALQQSFWISHLFLVIIMTCRSADDAGKMQKQAEAVGAGTADIDGPRSGSKWTLGGQWKHAWSSNRNSLLFIY